LGRSRIHVASDATLITLDFDGNELSRASVTGSPNVVGKATQLMRRPPALMDRAGEVAIMTPGWYTLVIDGDGSRREIKDGNCLLPIAIAPYAPGRLLTACASGELWVVGDKPAKPAAR
jgi:hypothetical protein